MDEPEKSAGEPPLGETRRDALVSAGKGFVGLIPLAGSVLAEVVGILIPQQRIERIESYLRYLNERLSQLPEEEARRKAAEPEAVDLFEDGALQAVRALSDERRRRISMVVAEGIRGEHHARLEAKRVLELLGQIDDDQIVILLSHLSRNRRDTSFREKHSTVLKGVAAHFGSDQDELDRDVLHKQAREHLMRLGLLAQRFAQLKKGETPQFDTRTGTIKAQGQEITPLGRLLLSRIGCIARGEV